MHRADRHPFVTRHDASARNELADAARAALERGEERAVLDQLATWLETDPADELILHWYALLCRALDEHEQAGAALRRGGAETTGNPGLAHLAARIALEAGLPAVGLFERAVALAPADSDARLGLYSAMFAAGDGAQARSELARVLAASPAWEAGHRQYAQLSAMLGLGDEALDTIERALKIHASAAVLHTTAIDLMIGAERFADALELADRASTALGDSPDLLFYRAIALDEIGRSAEAGAIYSGLGPARSPGHAIRVIRHLLRTGQPQGAAAELEPWLTRPGAENFWPLAALAWRLTGDERADWLEAQPGMVSVIDLSPNDLGLDALCAFLRNRHAVSGRFLDQSVRGGSQTDGPLMALIDPAIRRVRRCLVAAVESHVSRLPPPDPRHPLLAQRRDRTPRFAGSWSVRLDGAGFHASHHHPQGWISAALYLAVPEGLQGEAGQLALGESPADLGLNLPPHAMVNPRPGRIALFPSYMWHGTRPFGAGERMTIAFDIARPC